MKGEFDMNRMVIAIFFSGICVVPSISGDDLQISLFGGPYQNSTINQDNVIFWASWTHPDSNNENNVQLDGADGMTYRWSIYTVPAAGGAPRTLLDRKTQTGGGAKSYTLNTPGGPNPVFYEVVVQTYFINGEEDPDNPPEPVDWGFVEEDMTLGHEGGYTWRFTRAATPGSFYPVMTTCTIGNTPVAGSYGIRGVHNWRSSRAGSTATNPNLADLAGTTVQEYVTYGDGTQNPYSPPVPFLVHNPPAAPAPINVPNPTITPAPPIAGTTGSLTDDHHLPFNFILDPPSRGDNFSSNQSYQY